MDVFDRIMRFVDKNNLMPSDKLRKEYERSQTTKILNEFPCYEYLKEKIGMKRQVYDSLKDRYNEFINYKKTIKKYQKR